MRKRRYCIYVAIPSKPLRKCFDVAVLAAGTDLYAAAHRIPRGFGPFDFGMFAHRLNTKVYDDHGAGFGPDCETVSRVVLPKFCFSGSEWLFKAGYLFDFKSGRDRDRTDDLYCVKVVPARLSAQFGGCIETSSPIQ